MKNKEIKSIIERAQKCFSTVTKEATGKTITVIDGAIDQEIGEKLSNALFEVVNFPVDSAYEYARQIVDSLDNAISTDETDLDGEIDDTELEDILLTSLDECGHLEGYIYTSDLTAWLAESNYHIEYIDEALQEFEPNTGIDLLPRANYLYKRNIASSLIKNLFTK